MDIRVGHGFDVHAFAEGRRLVIGGVEIAHALGLLGHSDADVLLHAICDALLGAAALPADAAVLYRDSFEKGRQQRQAGDPKRGEQDARQDAESKYNGRVVLLSGKLDKVEETDSLVTAVFVFNQGMFGDEGIRCSMLPHHGSKLKSVPFGSEVSIKGYITGYNETDVILEQCSLVR